MTTFSFEAQIEEILQRENECQLHTSSCLLRNNPRHPLERFPMERLRTSYDDSLQESRESALTFINSISSEDMCNEMESENQGGLKLYLRVCTISSAVARQAYGKLSHKDRLKYLKKKDPKYGNTALHVAAYYKPEVIQVLEGFAGQETKKLLLLTNNHNSIPAHKAVNDTTIQALKIILSLAEKHGCLDENLLATDSGNNTILHYAALVCGPMVDYILKQGKDKISMMKSVNKEGFTAVHLAAMAGEEIIGTMLETASCVSKADVEELLTLKEKSGMTPIHMAAESSHKALNTIISYIHTSERTPRLFMKLLQLTDKEGTTPLHFATVRSHQAVACILTDERLDISDKKTLLSFKDMFGNTPVMFAAAKSGEALKQILNLSDLPKDVTHGFLKEKNRYETTCLHRSAAFIASPGVTEEILKRGSVKQNMELMIAMDNNGMTPLHIAAYYSPEALKIMMDKSEIPKEKMVKLLNKKDKHEMTTMHHAACASSEAVQVLLDRIPDDDIREVLEMRSFEGRTVLHMACERLGKFPLDLLKIFEGEQVLPLLEAKCIAGRTAFWYAISNSEEFSEQFLDCLITSLPMEKWVSLLLSGESPNENPFCKAVKSRHQLTHQAYTHLFEHGIQEIVLSMRVHTQTVRDLLLSDDYAHVNLIQNPVNPEDNHMEIHSADPITMLRNVGSRMNNKPLDAREIYDSSLKNRGSLYTQQNLQLALKSKHLDPKSLPVNGLIRLLDAVEETRNLKVLLSLLDFPALGFQLRIKASLQHTLKDHLSMNGLKVLLSRLFKLLIKPDLEAKYSGDDLVDDLEALAGCYFHYILAGSRNISTQTMWLDYFIKWCVLRPFPKHTNPFILAQNSKGWFAIFDYLIRTQKWNDVARCLQISPTDFTVRSPSNRQRSPNCNRHTMIEDFITKHGDNFPVHQLPEIAMFYTTGNRPGYEIEVKAVQKFGKQIKAEPAISRNFRKAEMIRSIMSLCVNPAASAVVVVVCSHGTKNYVDDGDGQKVAIQSLIRAMSNKETVHVPKILIIQACQNGESGQRVIPSSGPDLTIDNLGLDHSYYLEEKNTMVILSTLPNESSRRAHFIPRLFNNLSEDKTFQEAFRSTNTDLGDQCALMLHSMSKQVAIDKMQEVWNDFKNEISRTQCTCSSST